MRLSVQLLQELKKCLREERMDDSVCPWSKTVGHPLICILCRWVLVTVIYCRVTNHPKASWLKTANVTYYLSPFLLAVQFSPGLCPAVSSEGRIGVPRRLASWLGSAGASARPHMPT